MKDQMYYENEFVIYNGEVVPYLIVDVVPMLVGNEYSYEIQSIEGGKSIVSESELQGAWYVEEQHPRDVEEVKQLIEAGAPSGFTALLKDIKQSGGVR